MSRFPDLLLPEGTHLLHLGPQKTGSTTLQKVLADRRDDLPALGVDFPARGGTRARHAGWWALRMSAAIGRRPATEQDWDEYVAEVAACTQPRVLVSNEDFARADDAAAARIVAGLGGERPHVVAVVRRIDRYLPSVYQELVKAGSVTGYEDWLRLVLADSTPHPGMARLTWDPMDLATLVPRWAGLVGAENLTLVVADDTDRALVPDVFCGLLGLPEGFLSGGGEFNQSLGWPAAEVLRAFNADWDRDGATRQHYHRLVQSGVVPGLRELPAVDSPVRLPGLPAWAHELVTARAQAQHRALTGSGVRVLGDPGTLLALDPPVTGATAPDTVEVQEAAAMLRGMFGAAVRRDNRQTERLIRRATQLEQARKQPGTPPLDTVPTRALLAELRRRVLGRRDR